MHFVAGVYFEKANVLEYYEPIDTPLTEGQYVVVESKRGHELGVIKHPPRAVSDQDVTLPLKPVLRVATEEDLACYEKNAQDADCALEMCKGFVDQLELDMRVVNCEYILDRTKIIFNFTADERIDFRKLVRMLAQRLKTRIELRQIGVRDEAKLLGGIGPCGRLMCCLKYENDYYETARAHLPDVGERIQTPEGQGEVVGLNIIDVSMQVRLDGMEQLTEYHIEELETLK